MSSIPEEISFEIFLKVPLKSLLACKCVCKTWFSLISSNDFIRRHLNLTIKRNKPNLMLKEFKFNYRGIRNDNLIYTIANDSLELADIFLHDAVEIDYPFKSLGYSVQFMGSCDGLVCLWFRQRRSFCLWNLATREYKELPKPYTYRVGMVAFGYDYESNDYKLLAGLKSLQWSTKYTTFKAYSLRTNSWKTIGNAPYNYKFPFISKPSGVLVNGDFHWLAEKHDSSDIVLVSLDISNEMFTEMELPKQHSKNHHSYLNLGMLEGCLCLLFAGQHIDVEVWVMENYGLGESWTKRYNVNDGRIAEKRFRNGDYLRLMWSFKSGEILFGGAYIDLLLCDPVNVRVIEPYIPSSTVLYREECYFESLVPLNSHTYVIGEEQVEESERTPLKKKLKKGA